jgi:hypothetical protein
VRTFGIAIATALCVTGCSSSATDPKTYFGCYSLNDWHAELGQNSLKLSKPDVTLPARIETDKMGDYVLVERPVRYVIDAAGNYRLTTYRGVGTFFRLSKSPQPSLTLPVVNADDIQLPKVNCR